MNRPPTLGWSIPAARGERGELFDRVHLSARRRTRSGTGRDDADMTHPHGRLASLDRSHGCYTSKLTDPLWSGPHDRCNDFGAAPPPISVEPGPPPPPGREGRIFDKPGPDLNGGKPCSDADDDVLRTNVAAAIGLLETAAVLRRSGTPFEVYKRARKLGLWQGPRSR